VARYFGNKAQVELIGGVGTLVELTANTTLDQFEYDGLPDMQIGEDYRSAGDDVMVCRMDGGSWGLRKAIPVGGAMRFMFIYNEEAIYWYRLSKVFDGIAAGLGVTINLPDTLNEYYLAQGSFGKSPAKTINTGYGYSTAITGVFAGSSFVFNTLPININTNNEYFNSAGDYIYSNNGVYASVKWVFNIEYQINNPFGSGNYARVQVMQEACIGTYSLVATNIVTKITSQGFFVISGTMNFDVNLAQFSAMQGTGLKVSLKLAVKSDDPLISFTFNMLSDAQNDFTITPYDRQCQNTIVTAKQAMPKVTVADFFLDICQRFGYTISYNSGTQVIDFAKQSTLSNRELATDWNDKIESPLDSQFGTQYQTEFVFGSYAINNRYASEDGQDVAILEANISQPENADAYTSIMNTPTLSTYGGDPYSIGQWTDGGAEMRWPIDGSAYVAGNILGFGANFWTLNENVVVNGAEQPGEYTVSTDPTNGLSISTKWKYTSLNDVFTYSDKLNIGRLTDDSQIQTFFPSATFGFNGVSLLWMDNGGLTWQSALDTNYQWLSAILSKPRVHKVLLQLRATDLPFDFSKPVYWNCAYWYVISIQDYNPLTQESCVAVIAQIPDYPTA
jgi:hypothetical protein